MKQKTLLLLTLTTLLGHLQCTITPPQKVMEATDSAVEQIEEMITQSAEYNSSQALQTLLKTIKDNKAPENASDEELTKKNANLKSIIVVLRLSAEALKNQNNN